MDTKLKKFNSTLVFKIVAFLICMCCVLNCTSQAIIVNNRAEENDLRPSTMRDALNGLLKPQETVYTNTFKRHLSNYASAVNTMTGCFGDGSEEAYELWKSSIGTSNEALYETAKENVINHIIVDAFILYLRLVSDGVVEPLGMLTTAEYSDISVDITEDNIIDYHVYYESLCNDPAGAYLRYTDDKSLEEKAKKLGADGVFKLNNYYQITKYSPVEDNYYVADSYKPGYYAFKINDAKLYNKMQDTDIFISDDYGSALKFAAEYKKLADAAADQYPSGRYFIRDSSGRAYTNVKGLNEKSTQEEIKTVFDKLGFWCYDHNGAFYLPDGRYYDYAGTYRSGKITYDVEAMVTETTTMLVVPTQPQTTVVDGTAVTAPSAAEPTTQKPVAANLNANDDTPFLNEGYNGSLYYVGVDMYGDYTETNDLFTTTESQIRVAQIVIEDVLLIAGVMGSLFLGCFLYLIVRAGRRRGDREIHLMKTDMMFTDWRIALDVLAGWCLFGLFVTVVDEFRGNEKLQLFNILLSLVTAAFVAVVIDLVLFVTRHIKARTLLKRLSLVWFGIKAVKFFKNKVKPVINEKLLYTKDFSRGTLVRTGIIMAANLVVGFIASVEVADNGTWFIGLPWIAFNIGVFVWALRLIGGLHKLFSSIEEIRQGNYNVYINTAALPSTLRESADKVMSLRDGVKTAVDEAVRQEQTKTELITNVSHDLKTPLTSIINYVELLKKCEITDEDAKEYLGILGEKSDRLKKLIEDLVEASKASTGNIKVELATVSLNEMISQLLGEHADGLEKRKLNVIVEMPEESVAVSADGKLLYRVMENLIVNVEKYSLYGTRVYVDVGSENGLGTVSFRNISERPLNITADQLKERFVRGDESRSTEGNGLGLSIAQSLCDVQGGELEISINGDLFTAKVRLRSSQG